MRIRNQDEREDEMGLDRTHICSGNGRECVLKSSIQSIILFFNGLGIRPSFGWIPSPLFKKNYKF